MSTISTKNLIEWLHRQIANPSSWSEFDPPDSVVFAEAAAALATQAAEIERLREALKPFADYMDGGMDCNHIGDQLPDADGVGWVYLTYGDFRRARAALNGRTP